MTWSLDGEVLGIHAGNESLLPPWPPEVDGGGRIVKTSVATPVPVTTCAVCNTPVERHGEAGWRHEVALNARGGCVTPWPRP